MLRLPNSVTNVSDKLRLLSDALLNEDPEFDLDDNLLAVVDDKDVQQLVNQEIRERGASTSTN